MDGLVGTHSFPGSRFVSCLSDDCSCAWQKFSAHLAGGGGMRGVVQVSISMRRHIHRLSCLFVAGVSGRPLCFLVAPQRVTSVTSKTLMMLPRFPRKKDSLLHLTDLFAKGAWGRFSALDKLFFPSCELHVLPVVLTSRKTTPHVTAYTSPYGGGGCSTS